MIANAGRSRLIAVESDQGSDADGHRVGSEGQGLGHVGPAADAARRYEAHLAIQSHLSERLPGHHDGRDGRDTAVIEQRLARRAGSCHHAVDHDDVRARLRRELHVV